MNAVSATAQSPRWGRSILAVVIGILANVVLAVGTDAIFHAVQVFPPPGQPMFETGDNLLALSYRCVYAVVGGWLAARFAPRNPMRHAWVLGLIGTALGTLGAIVTIPMHIAPAWLPIAIAVTGLPLTLLGGWLFARRRA